MLCGGPQPNLVVWEAVSAAVQPTEQTSLLPTLAVAYVPVAVEQRKLAPKGALVPGVPRDSPKR